MGNSVDERMQKIKNMIENLISENRLEEAKDAIKEYENVVDSDAEVYSMKAVIAIMEEKIDDAICILLKGLDIDNNNFDILYNLGYVYEQLGNCNEAIRYYNNSIQVCTDEDMKDNIASIIENIKLKYGDLVKENRTRIVFFVKYGMDSFLGDIIEGLSVEYETRKIIVTEYTQIDEGMRWADICWFEWCDELVIYGSKLELAERKKILCRLHRYEALTEYPKNVMWENVDKLIIVTDHLKKILNSQIPKIEEIVDIVTIENGVNLDKYKLKERSQGFNIAYVGYIHQRKNPVLLLQIINKLVKIDERYKLYIAGQFQDPLIELYWNYQVEQMGLKNNIIFEGWQNNINEWLEDKNYIISSSIHESFGYGIAESMSRGIKPVIHNFLFANEIWDNKYLFNTIDEAVNMIIEKDYDSWEYRKFIEDKYSFNRQINQIKSCIEDMAKEFEQKKTISIINRSYSGSNAVALYKFMPNEMKNKFDIYLIEESQYKDSDINKLANSEMVVTTHGNYSFNERQLNLELWHGFPIKGMAYMDKNSSLIGLNNGKEEIHDYWKNLNKIISYSNLYNTVMNSCIGIDGNKYVVTGYPRNDLLLKTHGRENLNKIFNISYIENKKIIFYMPTFRQAYGTREDGNRTWDNIFGMKNFDNSKFEEFLKRENILLILKIHPNEEYYVMNYIKKMNLESILLLENRVLEQHGIDLYETVNAADLLITDYSSIYFDYLLLNRPIIFTPVDLEEYSQNRGFLLEPFEEWSPGPKVVDQSSLEKEICRCLCDNSYYERERKRLLNMVHYYKDGESSQRVWSLIDSMMQNV